MDGYSIGGEDQFDFHGDCFCCVAVKIKNMQEVEKRYEQRGMDLFFRSLFSILEQALQGYDEYNALLYDRVTITVFVSFGRAFVCDIAKLSGSESGNRSQWVLLWQG